MTEEDLPDMVQLFTPSNNPGQSLKEEWADQHIEFAADIKDDSRFLTMYSDRSLTETSSRRRMGYGVVRYCQGQEVFHRAEALGKHVEVYDLEMAGLHTAAKAAWNFISNMEPPARPTNIIFYVDNTAAVSKIFEGTHGEGVWQVQAISL